MKDSINRTRVISLLCAVIFLSSLVLSGCSVKKITQKDAEKTNIDDSVEIGQGFDEDGNPIDIVVGEDGQTYQIDAEGNTKPYTGKVAPTVPSTQSGSNTPTYTQSPTSPRTPTQTPTKAPTPVSTTSATPTIPEVYNKVAIQRGFGFNKAYDKFAGLANFFLDSITVYFEYAGKYWLVEFWKGEYALCTVGCEIGFYYTPVNKINSLVMEQGGPEYLIYGQIDDSDAMYVSMKLWQYKTPDQTTPVKMIDYHIDQPHWWAADFQTGTLYKSSDRTTLVMVGSIQFPNNTMKNLFVDGLKEKGFKEGTIDEYRNYETYQVDGNKVTVCWKNYSDGYQVSK